MIRLSKFRPNNYTNRIYRVVQVLVVHTQAICMLHACIYNEVSFENGYFSKNKKHIDTSVKERPQTPLAPSKEICKRVLCNKHI